MAPNPVRLAWRQGEPAPEPMKSLYAAATVQGNVAYFSVSDSYTILTYTLPDNKWGQLPQRCSYCCFGMAVVNSKLTTIGGTSNKDIAQSATNVLLSLVDGWRGKKWKDLQSPMPTKRMCPAAVATPTHLVVAGGGISIYDVKLAEVEVMNTDTFEWFQAHSLPLPVRYPQMTMCDDFVMLCEDSYAFSCSLNELLIKSSLPGVPNPSGVSVWTRRASIPVQHAPGQTSLKGKVLAIGGKSASNSSIADIFGYDPSTNSWSVIGRRPTPRSLVLPVVLPVNQLVVVGGVYGNSCVVTEIGECF